MVVDSALFFAVACWEEGACTADRNRIDKLIKKASPVVGSEFEFALILFRTDLSVEAR